MAKHLEIGKKGEEIASAYLLSKGYQILQRNYRFKHMEIDIIAKDEDELVIVEVKTRQNSYLAGPEDTVTRSKQKLIIKAANEFIVANAVDLETRFDIISVLVSQNQNHVNHIKSAFYPT